jgi:hypothetical protein
MMRLAASSAGATTPCGDANRPHIPGAGGRRFDMRPVVIGTGARRPWRG